jgi:hypothetical protein
MCIIPATFTATHLVPVGESGLECGVHAEREAGVVDQHIERPPIGRQAIRQRGDRRGIGDVQCQRQQGGPKLLAQRGQPLSPSGCGDDTVPSRTKRRAIATPNPAVAPVISIV